jgi:hypothetical protein
MKHTIILTGDSIKEIKNRINRETKVFVGEEGLKEARKECSRLNKSLTPGEKEYFGLKYKVEKVYTLQRHSKGKIYLVEGTLAYLIDYFSYTLECGNSWDIKISRNPVSIKSLINNINASYPFRYGDHGRDYVELSPQIAEGIA